MHQLCGKPPGNQTDLHNSEINNNSTSCVDWLIAHQVTNPSFLSDNKIAAQKDLRAGFSKLFFFLARGKTSGANYICQTVLRFHIETDITCEHFHQQLSPRENSTTSFQIMWVTTTRLQYTQ